MKILLGLKNGEMLKSPISYGNVCYDLRNKTLLPTGSRMRADSNGNTPIHRQKHHMKSRVN